MGVSCDCSNDGDWWYSPPRDFTPLETKRRRRCYSCRQLIDVGADCGAFHCLRTATEWEEVNLGWIEAEMPSVYMCEECTGLYFSITDLGFCINLVKGESMRELARLVTGGW